MPTTNAASYSLGLQIRASQVAWACVQLNHQQPESLLRAGVRQFDPGVVGSLQQIQRGQDTSKNATRQEKRGARNTRRRKLKREAELGALLQTEGLLPAGNLKNPLERVKFFNALDKTLTEDLSEWRLNARNMLLPYLLRAEGLDHPLSLYALGRALYHLVQRRGYKSNRRKPEKEGEEGAVKQGITDLSAAMETAGARTLGEYFAGVDPETVKVRRRWTARAMFEKEFDLLWAKQASYAPEKLTPKLRKQVWLLLFDQAPLRSVRSKIGRCELEPKQRRAPWASLEAQRFRMLQKINDLRFCALGQLEGEALTAEERAKLLELLTFQETMTFAAVKKQFSVPRTMEVNLQRGGESRLLGDNTSAHHLKVFGEQWFAFSAEERERIVNLWRAAPDETALVKIGTRHLNLNEDQAKLWAKQNPEPGYCMLSRKALRKLLPLMEEGLSYATALEKVYGEQRMESMRYPFAPPVRKIFSNLANPAVERALTETRKVVNALVRRYGKPAVIHLELSNELRHSRHERQEIMVKNRRQEAARQKMRLRIEQECGIPKERLSRADLEKAMLWEESGGICVYTGREIPFPALFEEGYWVVTTILPASRYPDESFTNKTLISAEELRTIKKNLTPYEAYSSNPELYTDILGRVRALKGGLAEEKLRRFELHDPEEMERFANRQLNDMRYTTQAAMDLLGTLYGGRDEVLPNGLRRHVVLGRPRSLVDVLRRHWGMRTVLDRTDTRSGAVDAVVVACATDRMLRQTVQVANQRENKTITTPWLNFIPSLQALLEKIVVSQRPQHGLGGSWHQETFYTAPTFDEDGRSWVRVRKPVTALNEREVDAIVDNQTKEAVKQRCVDLKGDLSACATTGIWPTLERKNGVAVPIRRARIEKALTVVTIGKGAKLRYVANDRNAHMEVFELTDANGNRYVSRTVSLLEAQRRRAHKLPVVNREMTSMEGVSGRLPRTDRYETKFAFSLMLSDLLVLHKNCDHDQNICKPDIYRVRVLSSNGQIALVLLHDGRAPAELDRWSPKVDALRKLEAAKVTVDLLGEVHPVND